MKESQARLNLIAHQSGEHLHDFAQILIGLNGKMECEFEKDSGQISSGTLAIVPDSQKHLFCGLSDDSELLVIDLAPFDPYIQALEHSCNLSFKDSILKNPEFITLSPELLPMLDFAANQLAKGDQRINQQSRYQINCQLITLFITQLCQQYSATAITEGKNLRLSRNVLNHYIDQHLSNPPNNHDLANALNLSESHFYSLCQKELHQTPQQYIMSRRLNRARFLLQNSDISPSMLADELGFSDVSSFSRAFKRYFHITPGHARKMKGE
ncbi:AraC family transcriptional regulator [Amphritea japonica]|uniref:AraC family transcriptional regulator n=1 Tax=Amphritea japonica ATCC BAA-1530 TaxID=1278309 RepID=A0A7R6PAD9_9GAMM|nr:AraC family transcriptional regulator [Amphritea japonica]BBB25823.1 AraC family transcriptional regulator [Amphritea japonica ATCC BAA-1530]